MLFEKDRVNVLNKTGISVTDPLECKFDTIVSRPNKLYAYAYAILFTLVFTAAEVGTASLAAAKVWQVLQSVYLKYGKHTRCNNLSGLNILQYAVQGDEIWAPNILSKYIQTSATDSGAGNTTFTQRIVYPLAPGMLTDKHDKFSGLIPLSEFNNSGELKTAVKPANAIISGNSTNGWAITAAGTNLRVDLLTVNLPYPVEHIYMTEAIRKTSEGEVNLAGKGERLVSALMLTDDADENISMPESLGLNIDNSTRISGVTGAHLVELANMGRKDGINDLMPAVVPLVTLADREFGECLPVYEGGKITDPVADDQGQYKQVIRYSQRISRNAQRGILIRQAVDSKVIDAYLDSMDTTLRSDAADIVGQATVALKQAV